ncbi:Biuret hydrolase [Thiomonas arsenitoxydans]|jgi:AtzE family amidohydrolase|uniref:Biuret hydrolase n=1 Tax=Thiomonas arsenitoxydans (strain DSM 22701 / CIP 110005 / 3As) TaxID=426114 RepID=D6CNU5_THIA3|nr:MULTISPECIES: AtzE family amidohydrolase [Thiomonas]OZB77395.1 MAG: AtzE family amidohydrolase [Thiomonas sp. 14-64-326]CAZ90223.1 putative Glutamyl-tRNA(Gln) amidotransferase subunit A [Thiomonas arsenitoxydans]CDW93548.1 Biuret hydrolase [Thiomonas sp. CB2]CQR31086.1 Biuret hydrolase [Thiomonas arsenitoxydans]CQR36645.1 Biuret hydrolase [Thiomonas arsenitoxydans]
MTTSNSSLALQVAGPLAQAIASGEISALEVTEQALARIAAVDGAINAFTAITAQRARDEARRIDALRAQGAPLPPLAGVPYAVKNLFDIFGLTTLAGSKLLATQSPATNDAVLVQRMQAAGAVLVGALNMDEFAYGFTTENSHYGPTRNPHDPTRSAGGSSGGSAAAIAAGMVPLALGSDTNGSIRVPSSLCGIFGIKPTFGRLSRSGSYPFVYNLDHLGAFARSVDDLALCYEALCAGEPPRSEALLRQSDTPLRVGQLGGYFDDHAGPQAREAVGMAAEALGARDPVNWVGVEAARSAAFLITAAEGGQLHLDHLRTQYDLMEPLSRDRLAAGSMLPAAWYAQAQRVRARFHARALELFSRYDLLIAAATPVSAQPLDSEGFELDGRMLPTRANMGLLTQPISCIGLPVVAAPIRHAPGAMPIGVQLIAPPWREDIALRAAKILESAGVAFATPVPI